MNHRMRRIVETLACERRYGIADAKGAEYSGKGSTYKETGADTLANFKNVAERIGGTPEQVLMTYLLKHIDSINTTVREAAAQERGGSLHGSDGPSLVYASGEGIVSRLDDARNYLDLLECLLMDNGHIEEAWDEQGMKYAEIGLGAMEAEKRYEESLTGVFIPKPVEDTEFYRDAHKLPPFGWPEPTKTSVGEDDAGGLDNPTESPDFVPEGSIRGFDGVVRPKALRDESVRGDQVQTPICETEAGPVYGGAGPVYDFDYRPGKAGGFIATPKPAVHEPKDPETGEL